MMGSILNLHQVLLNIFGSRLRRQRSTHNIKIGGFNEYRTGYHIINLDQVGDPLWIAATTWDGNQSATSSATLRRELPNG
jgi:hypothetical protein